MEGMCKTWKDLKGLFVGQWCLREKASLGDWSLVCTYKKEGGLGICKLAVLSKAILGNGVRDLR